MGSLSKWLKKAEHAVSNIIPHQHSADRRAANQAVADQIDYYQKQKEELNRIESDRTAEKQRIAQKQVKSARHAYRAPGFMEDVQSGYGDKLG